MAVIYPVNDDSYRLLRTFGDLIAGDLILVLLKIAVMPSFTKSAQAPSYPVKRHLLSDKLKIAQAL